MSGASISFDVSRLIRLKDRTRTFLRAVSDKPLLLDGIGEALVTNVDNRFDEGKAPDGTSWTPVKRGGTPLVKSGLLRDSITYETGRNTVTVGTNRIDAAVHQFGATIKPKKKKALAFTVGGTVVFAKSVTIPARPYLGINDDDVASIRGTIADFILLARRKAI